MKQGGNPRDRRVEDALAFFGTPDALASAYILACDQRTELRALLRQGIEWSAPFEAAAHELDSLAAWQAKARAAIGLVSHAE